MLGFLLVVCRKYSGKHYRTLIYQFFRLCTLSIGICSIGICSFSEIGPIKAISFKEPKILDFGYICSFSTKVCLLTLKRPNFAHFGARGLIFLLVFIYLSYFCLVIVNTLLCLRKVKFILQNAKLLKNYCLF